MAPYQKPGDRLKEITDKLEQGIQELFQQEQYKAYLKTMSKFTNYSVNNSMLIFMQRPDASLVAGYGAWQKNFNRHVKRGEHGIKILAPCPYKDTVEREKIDPKTRLPVRGKDGKAVTEQVEITRAAFKPVTVFDLSQTEGDPLPQLGVNELTGTVEHYKDFFEALKQMSPFPISFEPISTGAKGYCNYETGQVVINEGMSEVQNVKTAIHEITHATLHDYYNQKEKELPKIQKKDRRTREVEAESVAYVVCQHYGIETSDYSFPYVAGWEGQNKDLLKSSLATIRETADRLITSIDETFQALAKERETALEPEAYRLGGLVYLTIEAGETGCDYVLYYPSLEERERGNLAAEGKTPEQLRDLVIRQAGYQDYSVEPVDYGKLKESLEIAQRTGWPPILHPVLEAEGPEVLAPSGEPMVHIIWSEHPQLKDDLTLPLHVADRLFLQLDEKQREDRERPDHHGGWYEKTKFEIQFTFHGEAQTYEGRQDFGDGDGSLIDHIRSHAEHYRNDKSWHAYVLQEQGPEGLEQEIASYDMILNDLVPYLQTHCKLAEMEVASRATIRERKETQILDPLEQSTLSYFEALAAHAKDCRQELNTAAGAYQFPEAPKLEDFLAPYISGYKQQVQEEVKQEAASYGMTVEEYAANGWEPPASFQPAASVPEGSSSPSEAPSPPASLAVTAKTEKKPARGRKSSVKDQLAAAKRQAPEKEKKPRTKKPKEPERS